MARLESYQQDTTVGGQDKLIGTNSSNSQTSNYTIDSVGKYMSENNVIKIANQVSYKFIDNPSDTNNGTFFVDTFNSDGSAISSISTIHISKFNSSNENIEKFIRKIFEDKVFISKLEDQDHFCVFDVVSVSVNETYTNFLSISVSNLVGDGVLAEDFFFAFSIYSVLGDKNFIYNQETGSTTWSINHGLGKNPSVTIVNSANVQVVSEVEYIDSNNIEIRFVNSTAGKAYLN
jgi:hypothetical protein